MALVLDTIRQAAERVAASHGLELVDLEYSGGAKFRTLRVYLEKGAEGRARLQELARQAEEGAPLDPLEPVPVLPAGVPVEQLSGVTHEDCEQFARDFGVLLDVEDLVPGAEYTLEVSSPGLERKLSKPSDYTRFVGSLLKLQTFTAVDGNRHFAGKLTAFDNGKVTLDPGALKSKSKPRKGFAATSPEPVTLEFSNIEKCHLVPQF